MIIWTFKSHWTDFRQSTEKKKIPPLRTLSHYALAYKTFVQEKFYPTRYDLAEFPRAPSDSIIRTATGNVSLMAIAYLDQKNEHTFQSRWVSYISSGWIIILHHCHHWKITFQHFVWRSLFQTNKINQKQYVLISVLRPYPYFDQISVKLTEDRQWKTAKPRFKQKKLSKSVQKLRNFAWTYTRHVGRYNAYIRDTGRIENILLFWCLLKIYLFLHCKTTPQNTKLNTLTPSVISLCQIYAIAVCCSQWQLQFVLLYHLACSVVSFIVNL